MADLNSTPPQIFEVAAGMLGEIRASLPFPKWGISISINKRLASPALRSPKICGEGRGWLGLTGPRWV